ncbi:hypothetical protein FIBSPDRAFT_855902 [Athelia psychrophila]|uniref:Uncharacterized protein n=1 Tax=Athelia psychrophila TaxID=1759441 RepID=A0A166NTQ9_9AGAM|nr:hypothetical protein FIBSPDRAFT_855902 [Fibularhizoctonia sp. CBS 109695]
MLVTLLDKFGAQLRTLELARSLHSLDADYLVPALRRCHALQEIGYSVHITLPPRHNIMMGAVNDSVRVVRLQGTALANSEVNWGDLEAHFRFLAGPALPALQTVVLYPSHGIWDEIMGDQRFAPLGRALRGRGCVLQRADGEPVLAFDLSTSS